MNLIPVTVVVLAMFSSTPIFGASKILFIYPVYFPSHWRLLRSLLEELAKRGHQITAYTSVPGLKSFENFEHKRINANTNSSVLNLFLCRSMTAISYMHFRWKILTPQTEAALKSKELQGLMKSGEHFDLMIVEALFVQESLLAFSHKFHIPVVSFIPSFLEPWTAQLLGVPHTFSYIPNILLPYSDHMNFWRRTKNTLIGMYSLLAGNFYYLPTQERLMRENFQYEGSENSPPLRDLISNISLHLVLSHPLLTSVRPHTPHIIDITGIDIQMPGDLTEDLKKFLDEATDGFIYLSFGSYGDAQMFPQQYRNLIVETLRDVKQRVIMKWSENIEGASNILARLWLPQKEILAHPNCKLFITHGGFNSLVETTTAGVPTIGLPFFSDQWHNVAWYVEQGVGLELHLETTSVADFTHRIEEVIHTTAFMENAKRISAIFRDDPSQSKLDNAVVWVEYVIRQEGAHHLKPASTKMPYYQYLLLDVIAFLTGAIVLVIFILRFFTSLVMQWLVGKIYKSQKKKEI